MAKHGRIRTAIRRSMHGVPRSLGAISAVAVCIFGAGGCGGGGVEQGAVLSVYVGVPLGGARAGQGRAFCLAARRQLALSGERAASFRLRVHCLDDSGSSGRWSLAAVGANARRAVEDSGTIAYVAEQGSLAARFSRPIVETAGIPQVDAGSAEIALKRIVRAIRLAGTPESSVELRDSVSASLTGG